MSFRGFIVTGLCCFVFSSFEAQPAFAQDNQASVNTLEKTDQRMVANFLARMKNGYARANAFMNQANISDDRVDLRGLPDGELLIMNFKLKENIPLEGTVFGQIQNRQIYLSLNDMISLLNFPISYDRGQKRYSGWFVRENRLFDYDIASDLVRAAGQEFNILDDHVLIREDEVYVARAVLENWFDLTLEPNIGDQFVLLDADPPLPVMERLKRRNSQERNNSRLFAKLPRGEDDYDLIAFPKVDVNTRSTYRNLENSDPDKELFFNVRTSGDLAYGNLTTNISGDKDNNITNARVTYSREADSPELLGGLKARRFEVGDIQPTRIPILGSALPELGARITNVDPLRSVSLPSTQITGYILPGWDVELYRDNSLLRFVETDDNGYYSFDNIQLFSSRNAFRVVAYGPQGEVREENVSIPYDPQRNADDSGIYDVSVSLQNRQTYSQFDSLDDDEDTPHVVGFYETPIGQRSALQLGGRYRQEDEEHKVYASAGVSTSLGGALVNASVASDEEGEWASELVYTKQFGPHNFRSDLDFASDEYDPGQNRSVVQTFSNRYSLEGPLPVPIGEKPRYGMSFNYAEDSDGDDNTAGRLNFNTTYKRLGFNQSLLYSNASSREDETIINSNSAISGSVGKDTYRFLANYQFKPQNELDSLFASWRRRISSELETQLEVGHTLDTDITRLAGQLNWRPDYVTISPRFSYDSDGNIAGTINTRFGVSRNSVSGDFELSRDFLTTTGSVDAFVFLDKNGNRVFDGEDEPIPDAGVLTPQNGSGGKTDENGAVTIKQLRPNILTDVYVDQSTLTDPYWIAVKDGVSIMPREGTNVRLDIPVQVSGEIDGSVYVRVQSNALQPLRDVRLALYNEDGEIEQSARTSSDGFYLFSLVPPGRYALSIVPDSVLPDDVSRPRPQFLEIGYDGTTIFANDVILEAGKTDIPTAILANMDDYKANHPHIDFSNSNNRIVLNLGAYKSRLLMSFMWYRLNTRYAQIFEGTSLYVPPSQSYASPRTGQHVLRAGLLNEDLDDAYRRCQGLVARGFSCTVEVYPALDQQKMAKVSQ